MCTYKLEALELLLLSLIKDTSFDSKTITWLQETIEDLGHIDILAHNKRKLFKLDQTFFDAFHKTYPHDAACSMCHIFHHLMNKKMIHPNSTICLD